jgi:pilus assembly protein CpaE
VSPDHNLRGEIEAALDGIHGIRAVTFQVESPHHGVEAARTRQPDLVCVDMDFGLPNLRAFVQELSHSVPSATVSGIYGRDIVTSDGGDGKVFIEAMRFGVSDFLRRPVSTAELEQLIERLETPAEAAAPVQHGTVVSFMSNKGGVGKSTVSLHTACTLAKAHPDQVLIIDASLQLGVCSSMLDLDPETTLVDAARQIDRLDEVLIRRLSAPHSSGLRVLGAPADAIEAADITEDKFARILSVARRAFDYVVVDTFPLLDGIVVAALDLSDLVYIVVQSTVPNVIGASRWAAVLGGLGLSDSRRRFVLNNNFPRFAGCLRQDDVAARLSADVNHIVPYDKRVMVALNAGRPLAIHASRFSRFRRAIGRISEEILAVGDRKEEGAGRPGADSGAAGGNGGSPTPEFTSSATSTGARPRAEAGQTASSGATAHGFSPVDTES